MPINANNPELGTPTLATGKGTIPDAVTMTGTLTSSGTRITGTGTAFLTEFRQGDYLYNGSAAANNGVREVVHILSDTVMVIASAFATEVTGVDVSRVRGKFRGVGVINTGSATGKLNEGDFKSAASTSVESTNGYVVKPMSYNATGTEYNIITTL